MRGSDVLTKIFAVRVIGSKLGSETIGRLTAPVFKRMLIKFVAEELKAELNQILDSPLLPHVIPPFSVSDGPSAGHNGPAHRIFTFMIATLDPILLQRAEKLRGYLSFFLWRQIGVSRSRDPFAMSEPPSVRAETCPVHVAFLLKDKHVSCQVL